MDGVKSQNQLTLTACDNDTALPMLLDFLKGEDVSGRTIRYPALRFVPLAGEDPTVRHPSVPR